MDKRISFFWRQTHCDFKETTAIRLSLSLLTAESDAASHDFAGFFFLFLSLSSAWRPPLTKQLSQFGWGVRWLLFGSAAIYDMFDFSAGDRDADATDERKLRMPMNSIYYISTIIRFYSHQMRVKLYNPCRRSWHQHLHPQIVVVSKANDKVNMHEVLWF